MSNKYSSDDGMQKLFEGFRRSLNEGDDFRDTYGAGASTGDVLIADMERAQRERDAARAAADYVYKQKGDHHLIHHAGGTFSIPAGGGQMSEADRALASYGFESARELADAANAGDKNAIYLIDYYTR